MATVFLLMLSPDIKTDRRFKIPRHFECNFEAENTHRIGIYSISGIIKSKARETDSIT